MIRITTFICLICGVAQISLAADRLALVEKLIGEYAAADKQFFSAKLPENPTNAETIRRYEDWPGWSYIPRFVELAKANSDDEAAFRCCQWLIDRPRNVGNADKRIFYADQEAWTILADHFSQRDELPELCCQAAEYFGPAQERFLRRQLERKDLSREKRGFATVALADLLAEKFDYIDFKQPDFVKPEWVEYLRRKESPDWGKDLVPANAPKFKAESIDLFHTVQAKYADVKIANSMRNFRMKNLGEKAEWGLNALEHLRIGCEAPDIVGNDLSGQPLKLHDYPGKVVVLSFWFTGCGPCMAAIPSEKRIVESFSGRPFALLGVCTDESVEIARTTATQNGIVWPCWFDGKDGPIKRNWNVFSFPAFYVLDKTGRIAAKRLGERELEATVTKLIEAHE
jgi:thiol-disulfide isomerase/thioredoxin